MYSNVILELTVHDFIAIPLIQDQFNATDFEMTLSIFSFTLATGIFPLFHGQVTNLHSLFNHESTQVENQNRLQY
jgi:hypothetical protein